MLNFFFISFYSGDEPKEKKIEVDNPEADPVEKDDENGKASLPDT